MPEPIHTDSAGPKAGREAGFVPVPARDCELPAWRALPAGGGPFPVVLVVQEIFGVNEYIADVCRRLARLGYFAIAPELSFRQGDPRRMSHFQEIRTRIVAKRSDVRMMNDLDACADFAAGGGRGGRAALHHRLLLGLPHGLALRRAQPAPQSRRCLVRKAGG